MFNQELNFCVVLSWRRSGPVTVSHHTIRPSITGSLSATTCATTLLLQESCYFFIPAPKH
jgi:hypothetical protein